VNRIHQDLYPKGDYILVGAVDEAMYEVMNVIKINQRGRSGESCSFKGETKG
jgi:hypothetical protein